MGFAIPSNLARSVVDALIAHGEVPRSDIGVTFKAIQRTGFEQGVLLNSLNRQGPAGQAGLQAGDIVTQINGEPITVRFLEQIPPLLKRIAELPVGAQLRVGYLRDGQPREAVVTTARLERDRGDEAAFRGWGITGMDITWKMAEDRRLDDADGVLVTSVRSGGPAATAEPPLESEDVLRAVDGEPIQDLASFISLYKQIMEREPLPEYLLIEFERSGQNHLTLLKPKPDEDVDPPHELRKAWIGVATQPMLRDLAAKLGYDEKTGFRVTRVYPGTRAAAAGLRTGDIITALNGEALTLRGMQDAGLLARQVRRLDLDETVTLEILRDGTAQDIQVPLEPTRLAPEEARRDRNRDFELTVREITFFDRDARRWGDEVSGVLVEQAEPAGWAGLGGIEPGDLVQRIAGRAITTLDEYRKIMEDIAEQQPPRVEFLVLRGVRTHFQFVEPDWVPTARAAEAEKTDSQE
jgi:serine protease Do